MEFDLAKFDIAKFDSILARGLCYGIGTPDKQVCIEAAICQTLGLPHGDDPGCVASSVRHFKIRLNDASWSSPEARAKGLRDLGIAQLGSKETVSDSAFAKIISEKTIRVLIPALFRGLFPGDPRCLYAAGLCEKEGTEEAALAAAAAAAAAAEAGAAWAARAAAAAVSAAAAAAVNAADAAAAAAARAAVVATRAVNAADAAAAAAARAAVVAVNAADAAAAAAARAAEAAAWLATRAAEAAAWTADAAAEAAKMNEDQYLILSANLALETLRELKSPGAQLLKHGGNNGIRSGKIRYR